MEKIKDYLLLAMGFIILVFFLLKGCSGSRKETPQIEYIKGDSMIVWDTVDRQYEVIKFKTKYYPKWDTAYVDTTDSWPEFNTPITRVYNDSLSDSNLTIFSSYKVLGLIKEQSLSYRLKTPLEIIKTVSRVDTLRVIKSPNWSLYGGLEVGGNTSKFNASPFLTLNAKKISITYRYGVIDKTHNIGLGIRLIKSRK